MLHISPWSPNTMFLAIPDIITLSPPNALYHVLCPELADSSGPHLWVWPCLCSSDAYTLHGPVVWQVMHVHGGGSKSGNDLVLERSENDTFQILWSRPRIQFQKIMFAGKRTGSTSEFLASLNDCKSFNFTSVDCTPFEIQYPCLVLVLHIFSFFLFFQSSQLLWISVTVISSFPQPHLALWSVRILTGVACKWNKQYDAAANTD